MAKEKLIVEHNSLVAAQYDMTAAEQNIVCMLLRQLQQEDLVDKAYSILCKKYRGDNDQKNRLSKGLKVG